jgi:large subunit ribosomal protein L10
MLDKINTKKQKKQEIVNEISAKVQKAKSLIFTDYQGLTHQQLETIKKVMKKLEAEYIATKNTLLKLALNSDKRQATSDKSFDGPTATLFIYKDFIEPIKELAKSIKTLHLPVIKFAVIEGQTYSADQIDKIAKLPPTNILHAQLLGQLQSPISGLHRALNWNLQKLVLTLNAIKENKASSA